MAGGKKFDLCLYLGLRLRHLIISKFVSCLSGVFTAFVNLQFKSIAMREVRNKSSRIV